MREAWTLEHRPWLYFVLRRFELCRWAFGGKRFHPEARWYARLVALWFAVTGYETELCSFCGGKVGMVWWCDDQDLWESITGYENGGGISCVQCFDDRAERGRIYLKWRVGPLSGYTDEE